MLYGSCWAEKILERKSDKGKEHDMTENNKDHNCDPENHNDLQDIQGNYLPKDLARNKSTVSNSSSLSTQEDSLNEHVNLAIDNARKAIVTLKPNQTTMISPESNGNGEKETESLNGDPNDVSSTLESLMSALSKSQERVKQLTLKNMLLVKNLHELQSGFQVEQTLAKQQFESMKYNLILQKTELQKQLEHSSVKITKYRETIMSKNKEINRLSRLLNQNQAYNPRLSRPNSMPSAHVRKPPYGSRQLHTSDSNMLNTLGILATKVLKEEQNPAGRVGTSIGTSAIVEEKLENPDNTESDISHDGTQLMANQSQQSQIIHSPQTPVDTTPAPTIPAIQPLPALRNVSDIKAEPKLSTMAPKVDNTELPTLQLNRPPLPNGTALPKLRSFNTADGTVKDIF